MTQTVASSPAPSGKPLFADLSDHTVREEFTPAAVRLFVKLADTWKLHVDQRRAVLGDISRNTYFKWARGEVPASLSRDQLERISLALGIEKGLRLLFAEEAGRTRWFTSPNRDVPFCGGSPLEHMLRGGMGDLYAVRRYLDAWRGMR